MQRELRSAKIIIANTAVMLAFLILLVASNLFFMNKMNNDLMVVDEHHSKKLYLILQLEEIIRQRSLSMMSIYLSDDPWFKDSEYMRFHSMAARFITLRDQLIKAGLSDLEQSQFDRILGMIRKTEPIQDEIVEQLRDGTPVGLRREISAIDMPLENEILNTVTILTEEIQRSGQEARMRARKDSITTIYIDIIASGLVLITLFLLMRSSLYSLRSIESELIDETESLGWEATHDHLTQTLNRRGLQQRFGRINELNKPNIPHSLIYIDLDNFKPINDQFGHDVGDLLLCHIAESFQNCIRKDDAIARIGGDEFALLLEDCDMDTANRISDCLLKKAQGFSIKHGAISASIPGCSIGIYLFSTEESDLDVLIKHADTACYESKHRGKNRITAYDQR
jgi:diguanylate cyclase (GGDEF)-like protein